MIYAYKHLPHKIEKFQENISYFFEQLFSNNLSAYDATLLVQSTFVPIVDRSRETLKGNLIAITAAYHGLSASEKLLLKKAFKTNTDIKKLCSDTRILPVKYDVLPTSLNGILKTFLTKLWEDYPLNELFEAEYGTIQEHFNSFISPTHQQALICPFCGLHKLKPSGSINRDAYDHYIPKALYPFVSINFQNLFPICHECNSDEKHRTDTPFSGSARREVFFPFENTYPSNELTITITPTQKYNPVNFKTLLYDINWDYTISLAGNADPRLKSWDEIFHIKRRYKENMLIYQSEWYDEIVRKYERETKKGTSFANIKKEILEDAEYAKLISPLGVLRQSYFSFIFSNNDLEAKLTA